MAAPTSARASPSGLSAAGDASHVELPGFRAEGCNVHVRIPPCDTLGHRADSWNVQKPDYTCELRTLTRGDTFILRLLTVPDADDGGGAGANGGGELFAEALWQPDRPMTSVIDAAVDSSRYFALRIENAATRQHTFIGIGFNDRETASQLKFTLSEHGKYLARRRRALEDAAAAATASHSTDNGTAEQADGAPGNLPRDMSLKGSIKVHLPQTRGKGPSTNASVLGATDAKPSVARGSSGSGGDAVGGGAAFRLPPPPSRRTAQVAAASGACDAGQPHDARGSHAQSGLPKNVADPLVASQGGFGAELVPAEGMRGSSGKDATAEPMQARQEPSGYDEDDFGDFVGQ